MLDEPDVRVTLVRPGGVSVQTFADGAVCMQICLGYLHDPDDGLLAEMMAKHEPVPWASIAVRNEVVWSIKSRKDLKDDTRSDLLDWIAGTPYFESS